MTTLILGIPVLSIAQSNLNEYTNSLDMTFNRISARIFTMESPVGELGRINDETEHEVTLINDFYMMTTEVTLFE